LGRHKSGQIDTDVSKVDNPTMTADFFRSLCDRIVPVVCNLCPDVTFADFRKLAEHDKSEHKTDSLVKFKFEIKL
jgi:hypothetical protein